MIHISGFAMPICGRTVFGKEEGLWYAVLQNLGIWKILFCQTARRLMEWRKIVELANHQTTESTSFRPEEQIEADRADSE
jgi:hypothetical protein